MWPPKWRSYRTPTPEATTCFGAYTIPPTAEAGDIYRKPRRTSEILTDFSAPFYTHIHSTNTFTIRLALCACHGLVVVVVDSHKRATHASVFEWTKTEAPRKRLFIHKLPSRLPTEYTKRVVGRELCCVVLAVRSASLFNKTDIIIHTIFSCSLGATHTGAIRFSVSVTLYCVYACFVEQESKARCVDCFVRMRDDTKKYRANSTTRLAASNKNTRSATVANGIKKKTKNKWGSPNSRTSSRLLRLYVFHRSGKLCLTVMKTFCFSDRFNLDKTVISEVKRGLSSEWMNEWKEGENPLSLTCRCTLPCSDVVVACIRFRYF